MRKTIYTSLNGIFGARHVRDLELNFIATRDMVMHIEEPVARHQFVDKKAHQSYQIEHTHADGSKQSMEEALRWFNARLRGTYVATLANDQQEILDARASIDGKSFPLLSERLAHDFLTLKNDVDKELNVTDDLSYLFTPPYIKGARRGENEAPLDNDPKKN